MRYPLYQVDAFTDKLFSGNPAAVCPLEKWLDSGLMQNIAAENNLSETAFFVKEGDHYHIRWMTPTSEVNLCGHATLASAFVIFNHIEKGLEKIVFHSRSGELIVTREGDLMSLDFPANKPVPQKPPEALLKAFPVRPQEVLFKRTYLVVFSSEDEIKAMKPDIKKFLEVETHGVIITARGKSVDFVSRFFAPDVGIDEDPVTGYAHTLLIPYWAEKLNKTKLQALQLSRRGGELFCVHAGNRVQISGKAVLYLKGEIELEG
ncbi:MAG: PhzF family phenazine biosynthesis protein [Candidatus Aminicenantales bacterium]